MEYAKTIGQLASHLGLPVSTLRYYERAGLVKPAGRSLGNYRIYDHESGDRIRFIRMAQATGFTLADIRSLLELRDGNTAPCREVRTLIEKRLDDTTARIEEFKHVQGILRVFLRQCKTAEEDADCHVMGRLEPTRDEGPVDDLKAPRRTGRPRRR